jgi:hypothetical protein
MSFNPSALYLSLSNPSPFGACGLASTRLCYVSIFSLDGLLIDCGDMMNLEWILAADEVFGLNISTALFGEP